MALPLTTKTNTAMNASIPSPKQHMSTNLEPDVEVDSIDNTPSSPFVMNAFQSENVSRTKLEPLSPSSTSHKGISPLKTLKIRAAAQSEVNRQKERDPRKISAPVKRFPVKINTSTEDRSIQIQEPISTPDEALRDNEGLTKAIQILEDDYSEIDYDDTECRFEDTILTHHGAGDEEGFADDTAFSTFSAVPDMTMFAKIGHTPTKSTAFRQTPRINGTYTPATLRRPMPQELSSPTPRPQQFNDGDTTNLLMDFTEQFNSFSTSTRRGQASPARNQTASDLFSQTHNARTPSPNKHRQQQSLPSSRMSNLLDFDIPPAPTPRSMPSVTPRELESLKSALLSEISSLKASLSGKDAEVLSLKSAIGDAEKRAGEGMEQVREERSLKEQLEMEKEAWEKRGREMELVLRNVKEEIVHSESEREDLEGRFEESEKRREAAEIMAQEAESKMAGMRAVSTSAMSNDGDGPKTQASSSAHEVEIAVEKVARELHTLYKGKHETKVAALKKSYEGRWDRKVRDLEAKVDELIKENDELRVGCDATMSGVVPRIPAADVTEDLRWQAAKDARNTTELEARVDGLFQEVKSVKEDNASLRFELQQERIEKGELVAACDELLALQEAVPPQHPSVTTGVENLRGSVSRASGLRAPNFSATSNAYASESRIGRVDRTRSGSAQGVRPGSGLGMRSGIMGSIEKMGSYKGRAE